MDSAINLLSLCIAFMSLCIAFYFAAKSRALGESQKTLALINLLAPACNDPRTWQLFINYMSVKGRLPNFSEADNQFIHDLSSRLKVKTEIVQGRLEITELANDEAKSFRELRGDS